MLLKGAVWRLGLQPEVDIYSRTVYTLSHPGDSVWEINTDAITFLLGFSYRKILDCTNNTYAKQM